MSTETTSSSHTPSYTWSGRRRRVSAHGRHSTRSARVEMDTDQPSSTPSDASTPPLPLPEGTLTSPLAGQLIAPRPAMHRRQGSTQSNISSSSMVSSSDSFWQGSLRRFLKAITFRQEPQATRDDIGGTSGGVGAEEYTHPNPYSNEILPSRLCLSCLHRQWYQHHREQYQVHHHHTRRHRKHKQHSHHQSTSAAQAATTAPAHNRCLSTGYYCVGCGEPLEHMGTFGSHTLSGPVPPPSSISPSTSRSRRNQEKRAAAAATEAAAAEDAVDRWDRNQDPSYAGPSSMAVDSFPQPEANNHRQRNSGSKRRSVRDRIEPTLEDKGPTEHSHTTHHFYHAPDTESRSVSNEDSKHRRSSTTGSRRRGSSTCSTTSNENVRQYLTGVVSEYHYPIRNSKRLSMTAQDALQRRLAAVTATTSGSNNTTTPYIPTMHDVAARRGSSSSTGTQERVVYWTDITRAEDEDMEQESVDGEGAHEDLDVDEQGSQKRRQQDKCQRTSRRPRRPRHRRSLLGPDTYGPTCSSPPSLSSSLAGSSSSLNTPSDSCGSTTSCSHPHEKTNYRRPSPVELPEILHLIFQALVNMTPLEEFSQRDLLQCLMVCKQWYIVGQKTLWRDIRLRDPEQLQKFIGFLQTTLPPRMPEPEDSVADIRRMPGAWCVESVERLGIENSQSWRSEDIRMRMDGFDDQYEGASEDDAMDLDDDSEGCDELMSGVITKASICSPSHQMNKFADNQLSFTSDQVVVKRIQDRTAGVKKIVLHKFKTLTDAEVLPLTTWFPNLVSIEFYICEMITDAVVVSLAEHCPRLQYLLLPGCAKVTDNGIKAVARHCPRLRHLDLRACSLVSDESLIEIAENCPDLWHLNCGRVTGAHRVTGKSIVPIAKNTSLNTLGLAGCGMTDDAVIKIAEYCREGLNRISLNCCTELTSAAIRALMIYCPSLAVLEIKKCLKIRDMAPLNHFVRQRILVELCPDLQKRLVAYKVELASQQAAAAVASSSEGNTSTATTPPARQESDDAGHENQQPPGANHLQTTNAQPGAAASTSSHTPSTILTTTTTTTTMTNTMITSTTTTTTTTTTTASTAITTIVTTQ